MESPVRSRHKARDMLWLTHILVTQSIISVLITEVGHFPAAIRVNFK